MQIKEMSPAQIMTGGFPAIADLAFGSSLAQHTEQYQHYAGWAYVCVSAIGRRVAGQPVRMGRKAMEPTAESWAWDRPPGRKLSRLAKMRGPHYIKALDADIEQIDTDPLLDAINRPNPVMTKWALLFHTIASLEITGRAYWWFTEGDEGELNIWPLPADWVTPIRTAEKLLAGYRIAPTGQFGLGEVAEPESVAYFGLPDPANPVTGAISPLQAQAPAIAVDEQIQSSQYRFFKNGAFPGILIRAGRLPSMTGAGEGPQIELTQAQRSQIYAMVKQNWQGSVNYNMPLIVDGGLIQGVERFSLTGQELDFLQSGQATKSRIFQSFGVNPIVAGEIAGVNRATAAVADSIFVAAVVNPLCTLIGEVMSAHIGEKDTYFWVELAQADDAELRLKQWQAFAPLGVVTKDEVRQEILGLPPVEDDTGGEYLGQSAAPPSPFGGLFGGGGPAFPSRPEEQNRLPPPEPEAEMEEGEVGKSTRPFGKYSEDQPRVPAGSPEGGQFGEGGAGAGTPANEPASSSAEATFTERSGANYRIVASSKKLPKRVAEGKIERAEHVGSVAATEIDVLTERFPSLKNVESVKIEISNARNGALAEFGKYDQEMDGIYDNMQGMIRLAQDFEADSAPLVLGKEFSVDDSAAGALRHEYGHHLYNRGMGAKGREGWVALHNKLGESGIERTISEYASSSPQESFAESFAAFTHSSYGKGARLPKEMEAFLAARVK